MENKEYTQLEKSQTFALNLFGSVGLWEALSAARGDKEQQAMIEAIATALLNHPEPAEA